MKTPFGPPFGFVELADMNAYLDNHSPLQVLEETKNWDCDPTDLVCLADIFNIELKSPEHAVELYKKALDILKSNPELISPDLNLQAAYAIYGSTLIKLKKPHDAITALLEAYRLDKNDYIVCYDLSVCYNNLKQFNEAKAFLDKIIHTDENILKKFLSEESIKFAKYLFQKNENSQSPRLDLVDLKRAELHHSEAINYFSTGSYEKAIAEYKSAISIYEKRLSEMLPESAETSKEIRFKLSLACLDLSTLYAETKSQPIKQVIDLLLKALIYNRNLNDAQQNLLYYIGYVNAFLKARSVSGVSFQQIAKLYNNSYNLLKTPFPTGTSGRNWEGAINLLKETERIAPGLPCTHHLLGLAYAGCKMDELAIDEWIKVYNLDSNFDFETRVILGL